MKTWSVENAQAQFGLMLDACLQEGPQLLSRHGEPVAVLLSLDEWETMTGRRLPDIKAVLLAPAPSVELGLPDRKGWRFRDIAELE